MTASFPSGEKNGKPQMSFVRILMASSPSGSCLDKCSPARMDPFPPEAPLLVNLAFLFTFFFREMHVNGMLCCSLLFFSSAAICRRISAGLFCAKMHSNKTIVASPPSIVSCRRKEEMNPLFEKKGGVQINAPAINSKFLWEMVACRVRDNWDNVSVKVKLAAVFFCQLATKLLRTNCRFCPFISPPAVQHRLRHRQRGEVRHPVRDQVRDALRDRVRHPVRQQVRDPVRDRVRHRLRGAVQHRLRQPVQHRLRHRLRGQVRDPVRQQV